MTEATAERRLATCRSLISQRRLVGQTFGYETCPCPAWDILLDLYVAHREGRPTYLWDLWVAANIPVSSAHRKISDLIRKGLFERSADTTDGRRVSVALSDMALELMEALLDRLSAQPS